MNPGKFVHVCLCALFLLVACGAEQVPANKHRSQFPLKSPDGTIVAGTVVPDVWTLIESHDPEPEVVAHGGMILTYRREFSCKLKERVWTAEIALTMVPINDFNPTRALPLPNFIRGFIEREAQGSADQVQFERFDHDEKTRTVRLDMRYLGAEKHEYRRYLIIDSGKWPEGWMFLVMLSSPIDSKDEAVDTSATDGILEAGYLRRQ